MDVDRKEWKGVAISFGNVSELSLTLGDVPRAVTVGEESVELADKSGDAFQRMGNRTALQARQRLDAATELIERRGYGRRRPVVAYLEDVLRGRLPPSV